MWAVANASGSEAEFLAAMHSSGHGSADNILLMYVPSVTGGTQACTH